MDQRTIIQYDDATLEQVGKWDSAMQAANFVNTTSSNITQCCKRKRKTAGGSIWRYSGDDILPLYDKKAK